VLLDIARNSIFALSILVLMGGIMGFVKAKSKASLIAGVVSSILLAGSFALCLTNMKQGLIAGFVVSVLLDSIFAMRLAKTKKFMPSGLMLIFCATVQALIVGAFVTMRDLPG